ncbi:MAG TPA: zinc-dependent metalloprotease family protein [Ignavibacteriaceae bacterium]|nr:zinc-dependent metalloprotease family protein [Ignavibacteriaceae bacterium]
MKKFLLISSKDKIVSFKLFSSVILLMILFTSISIAQTSRLALWQDVDESSIQLTGEKLINPQDYRTVKLNLQKLADILSNSPLEITTTLKHSTSVIELPTPDGKINSFYFVESPVMEDELQSAFPEIRTYVGIGIDDEYAWVRFDFTPHGFHAMVRSVNGSYFIDPHNQGDLENYISYFVADYIREDFERTCEVIIEGNILDEMNFLLEGGIETPTGPQLRTYRLACAATGEYTQFHGGTVALGLAAVVTAVNRVTGVYETELAIRMVLVANNNLIIYTDPNTDPYSNFNGGTMLGQNISNLSSVIGNANFDIGHVFSTGGGGVAYLGVVCTANKAGGVTGLPQPIGDPFYIDYVAHEMGHQFGAHHTFNGSAGSCSGSNRNPATAYEPGSGSTIMAYAGICSPQNLQNFSDPHFHVASFDQIVAYTNFGSGSGCPIVTNTGNNAPVVTVPAGGFAIPINTPFALTGSAIDPDNDPLTYSWEEWDLGPAGHPNSPSGDAPIFRVFNPVSTPARTFPRIQNLLNNTQTIGEILPSYSRNLRFRLVARDNRPAGGGVDYAQINFTVSNAAGPFLVTYPNTNVVIPGLSPVTVTWNVANTNASPVNVSNVNILLSVDGGNTYAYTLASNTPNDGTEVVLLPDNETNTARIKVEAVGNVFFDISNVNFTIDEAIPVELISFIAEASLNGITLKWKTATETNNNGFSVEKSSNGVSFTEISFVKGMGTTINQSEYLFNDDNVKVGRFFYRLKQIDYDGTYSYSNIISVDIELPTQFTLNQNHPNPFNPTTKISFEFPVDADATLEVFNTIGQKVTELVNNSLSGGRHEFEFNAAGFSSGIYYFKLTALAKDGRTFNATKKMILMK